MRPCRRPTALCWAQVRCSERRRALCPVREGDGKRSVELSCEGEEIADVDVFKRIETRNFSAEFI